MRAVLTALLCLALATPALAQRRPVLPPGAPRIASDIGSWTGVDGGRRDQVHTGIDITGPDGLPILAAADGVVLEATVERCWGPTIAVDHGRAPDGTRLIALYGHVDRMLVRAGEQVRRGQEIARLGNNHNRFPCMAGVRHLHFQIGQEYRTDKGRYWGHMYFLVDGFRPVNPHLHWADGPNRVTCFRAGTVYPAGLLTYPVPCRP